MPTTLRTWLQLLRAPNLFTVPGDPLAGFLLASGGLITGKIAVPILASACFYAAGLLLNDLADLREDRRDRPTRPLPSGAARPAVVWIVTFLLAVSALALSASVGPHGLAAGLLLLLAITAYNLWTKRLPIVGALNMGACRGLSVLLGIAAALPAAPDLTPLAALQLPFLAPPLALLAAAVTTLYIAAITNLARFETHAAPPRPALAIPFFTILVGAIAFGLTALDHLHLLTFTNIALALILAAALFYAFGVNVVLHRRPARPIPPMIGELIRLLLPLQAAYCIASDTATGILAAALLLAAWPVSRAVSRRFYAS